MSLQAVLLPLFVEVILTFVLMLWMGALRGGDFRSGAVRPADVALREPRWPQRTSRPRIRSQINSNCRYCFMY